MAFCPHCGWALDASARFCSSCGKPSAPTPAMPPLGPGGATQVAQTSGRVSAPTSPSAGATRTSTSAAETLILIGGLLGALVPLVFALALLAFGAALGVALPFWGAFPAAIFAFIAVMVAILAIVWGAACLFARSLIQQGQRQSGAIVAVIAGLFMVLVGWPFLVLPGIAGLLVVAGGVMAWTAA
jgi:zinc ribbon protein